MKQVSKAIIIIFSMAFFVACGSEKNKAKAEEKSNSKTTEKTVKSEQVENSIMDTVEISVAALGESMNELVFEPQALSVPANSMIRLSFKNNSGAAGMLHNFVLVELGTGQEIATAGIKAGKDNDFVPNDTRVLFSTRVLDLGEEIVLEFKAPKKSSYHYICTYPGHYPKMIGRLNVQ